MELSTAATRHKTTTAILQIADVYFLVGFSLSLYGNECQFNRAPLVDIRLWWDIIVHQLLLRWFPNKIHGHNAGSGAEDNGVDILCVVARVRFSESLALGVVDTNLDSQLPLTQT